MGQPPYKRHKGDEMTGVLSSKALDAGSQDTPRLISSHELAQLYERHASQNLPECEEVFPWLHGYSSERERPRCAGLLAVLRSQPLCEEMVENSGLLKSSMDAHEFLLPWNTHSQDLDKIVREAAARVGFSNSDADAVCSVCRRYNVLPFLITDAAAQQLYGVGAKRRVGQSSEGWKQPGMFRRFDLQPAKFLELAEHCVVYCLDKKRHLKDCQCSELALLVTLARKCVDPDSEFTVSILQTTEVKPQLLGTQPMPLSSLQKASPSQLASSFDVASFNNWDRDLFYRERLEISKMSSASCADEESAVWCGNATDYEIYKVTGGCAQDVPQSLNPSYRSYFSTGNTIVKLPCLDYHSEDPSINDKLLFNVPNPDKPWRLFIHCSENGEFPTSTKIKQLIEQVQASSNISHTLLSFPSSGSIGLGNLNLESIKSILNVCYLIYVVAKNTDNSTLLYCSDGYTETSFLLVAHLIFMWDVPLEEVLLRLHKERQRPFFLFPVDLQVLGHLQILLRELSPLRKVPTSSFLDVDPDLFSRMFFIKPEDTCNLFQLKGPLPSRILPHLYLGSLEHAQCPDLLKKLDIKNIVSVGETMPWLLAAISRRRSHTVGEGGSFKNTKRPPLNSALSMSQVSQLASTSTNTTDDDISLFEENGFRVLHITNLDDNGQDRLLAQLEQILAFIDECRERGESVLVHCMVGVSRSATVCIAECMRRLNCDVLRAYLYVRVRRLNIIIQPNLMFMYELCKWQESRGIAQKVDWHIMCRSIAELNSNYL